MDLNALMIFARVVEVGSFSEAARRLRMPLSTVSRRVAELEDQLGVRLLERSTRRLRLTDLGAEVVEHARRGLEVGEAVSGIVASRKAEVSGVLRLSAPPSISDTLLAPLICRFQAAHPRVRVQVLVTDRMVDHIVEGVDVAFRLGELRDSSLVARPVLRYRHLLVASPAYLASHEPPSRPGDLAGHRLLAFSHRQPETRWSFVHADGRTREAVPLVPCLAMNDYAGLAAALLAGNGIGDLPPVVQPGLLRDGRLVEVMPDWRFAAANLSVVHLGSRHTPQVVRLFKEFAVREVPTLFAALPQ